MSFGRNPRVAKAEAAEQKANTARDATARELAWREAARQWDRAADRETDDKRRATYTEKAEMARALADGTDDPQSEDAVPLSDDRPMPKPPSVLN
jgi:hypothetical protein